MELRITVDSAAVNRLLRRAPQAYNDALEAAMNDAVTDLHLQMQTYPPARPGSTYKRRNILRASWLKRVTSGRNGIIQGEVVSSGSVAPYNVRVQKADMQARVHRGWWRNTDRAVMERSRRRVEGYFGQRVGRATSRLTG